MKTLPAPVSLVLANLPAAVALFLACLLPASALAWPGTMLSVPDADTVVVACGG